jgi:hypothetical protein
VFYGHVSPIWKYRVVRTGPAFPSVRCASSTWGDGRILARRRLRAKNVMIENPLHESEPEEPMDKALVPG